MLYSTIKSIHRFIFDSVDFLEVSLPVREIREVHSISFDINTEFIYWIDRNTNTIRRAYENGSRDMIVISGLKMAPFDLAIDPYGQQLYWTDAGRNDINVFSLKKMKDLGVVHLAKDEKPRFIVLYPEKGLVELFALVHLICYSCDS